MRERFMAMGNGSEGRIKMSSKSSCSSLRSKAETPQMPPDKDALHRSFNQLLGSLDLPADKIEEMNSYDDHKKWDILCSRSLMKVHQSPSAYLDRLRSHMRFRTSPSRETLRGLEVSLRTYSVEWLHDFLSERQSLDVLANIIDPNCSAKFNLSSENLWIALQCLRALLSDSSKGFAMTINHPVLFESLVANLFAESSSMKSRTLILQLLAVACQKSEDGQQRVLTAFKANGAQRQLMNFLAAKCSDQMLIVATLNLIRTLLAAATDMNYRVYLHYDFHRIGLDNRIERLMLNESNLISEVIDEITAYKSAIINVNQLVCERDSSGALRESLRMAEIKIKELERKLICYEEKIQEVEMKEKRKKEEEEEEEEAKGKSRRVDDGPPPLPPAAEAAAAAEMSEECKVDKIPEVDSKAEISQKSTTVEIAPLTKGDAEVREKAAKKSQDEEEESGGKIVTLALPPPPPPPPPSLASARLLPIRKKLNPKRRLPSLHWSPLRPNQIRGTIFNDLDDEKLCKIINFTHFEDKFCIADSSPSSSSPSCSFSSSNEDTPLKCIRMPKYETLLESNRLRNISILLRKLNVDADTAVRLINDYDFNQLNCSGSSIRLLTNLAPKDEEISAYRLYTSEGKDVAVLSDEDKFLLKLSRVERLQMKLNVIEFMATFSDRVTKLTQQLAAISAAALSLESSKKFRGLLEIILTFGNYMNGNKSGGYVYGFHLRGTLEKLSETRSSDSERSTLLQFIVANVVAQHFPQLLSLGSGELSCIQTAARISMKNVANEVANIESGWREMNDECDLSLNTQLRMFRDTSRCECNKLMNECEKARSNFERCLLYFGEDAAVVDSCEFFGTVGKFIGDFRAIADKVKLLANLDGGSGKIPQ